MANDKMWYEEENDVVDDDYVVTEYDITASPNDFNIKTIYDFLESGYVKIPGFQRNYVWDIKRASKLIESIIIGLPIPQIFLYEQSRNNFLVIDGQQRLMSIYYFIKKRFPKKEKRAELRRIFDDEGNIPEHILSNDAYFTPFNLRLPESLPDNPNKFNKLNYGTLGEYKTSFDIRTIRNIIIKQNRPENDNAIYEIFNRLNSGGLNLTPQEIRSCLYHSNFYNVLNRINADIRWRKLIDQENPDLHMKDIEVLLRSFAMLVNYKKYRPSMTKFLNSFSKSSKNLSNDKLLYFQELFDSFLKSCSKLGPGTFFTKSGKFNISMFESVFTAVCRPHFEKAEVVNTKIEPSLIKKLKEDKDFINATQVSTASKENVKIRIGRAMNVLGA